MMMSSEASRAGSGVAASRCMTKTPEFSTRSWVRLYLVRLIVTRGASGTIAAAPADSDIRPLARPSWTVVTATGNGRSPDRVYSAAFRSRVIAGDSLLRFAAPGCLGGVPAGGNYGDLVGVAEV